jgi:glycosyltransferase involved in cell wall biosynthesis
LQLYINNAKENWVVDRFIDEWNYYNFKQSSTYLFGKKIIWIIAPWTWQKLPKRVLRKNKVLCTIHHIDEDKFSAEEEKNFYLRDEYVDAYHAISNKTYSQLRKLTEKKIYTIPFWANQNIWYYIQDKKLLRKKYNINFETYLVGSFQRDTEGSDLLSPKLSKGPDIFIEIIENLHSKHRNLKVLLAGKRRQFVINELEKRGIEYFYYEMADFKVLNELYNLLDLYVVSSRVEGGPQSIIECSLTKTPIISTNVGIAPEILNTISIFNMKNYEKAKPDTDYAYSKVEHLKIPQGFKSFNDMISEL